MELPPGTTEDLKGETSFSWTQEEVDRSNYVCTRCKLVSILEEKVQGLEKQVSTLRCVRETEDFLDRRQDMLLQAQCSEDSVQAAQRGQEEGEEIWQHVTSRRRKGSVHVPAAQIQKTSCRIDCNETTFEMQHRGPLGHQKMAWKICLWEFSSNAQYLKRQKSSKGMESWRSTVENLRTQLQQPLHPVSTVRCFRVSHESGVQQIGEPGS
ncbi:uncharacterized protein [Lepidochelys kempii]|uniref:uncharacterized protein n=1 Tax=Lepidochelys kempii TaxID=8472 RepID=UPI003C6FD074